MDEFKCSCSGLNGECPICGDGILTSAQARASDSEYVATKSFAVPRMTTPHSSFDEAAFVASIERDSPVRPSPLYAMTTGPTPTKRKTKICGMCGKAITERRFIRHQAEVHGHHATRVTRT
jgi:hypothetical protein